MLTEGIPSSNSDLRKGIYAGTIYRVPASPASLLLVSHTLAMLESEFGTGTALPEAQFQVDATQHYERVSRVRTRLVKESDSLDLLFKLLAGLGFDRKEHAVDPARLRAVLHNGHENPLAVSAYVAHRDTWYASPQSQINFWMPLFDVTEAQTFAFFPAYFATKVENNSGEFDYDRFMEVAGWQKGSGGKQVYPDAKEGRFDRDLGRPFALNQGDIVVFSAAHLHQTVKNVSGVTRFSLDFRTVHAGDHEAGEAAPNVDNCSTGCALKDFIQPD